MPEQDLTIRIKQEGAESAQQGVAALLNQLKGLGEQMGKAREAFQAGQAAAGGMGGALNLLSQGLSLLATPVGAAVAAVGALAFGLQQAASGSERVFREVRNLQTLTGQTAEDTSALARAFRSAGVDTGTLQAALFRMSLEVETGGKGLGKLGITLRDASGAMKEPGQLMVEVINRIRGMGDAMERSAALMQVFGRAGRGIALALSEHNESLNALLKTERERTAVTEGFMRQAAQYDSALARLSDTWDDLKVRIGAVIALPLMTSISELTESLVGLGGVIIQAVTPVLQLVVKLFKDNVEWVTFFIDKIVWLANAVTRLVSGPLNALQSMLARIPQPASWLLRLLGVEAAAGVAPETGAAEATIRRRTDFEISMTEQRLRMEEDSDRKQRGMATAQAAERIKLVTASETQVLQVRLQALANEERATQENYDRMLALELERAGKEGAISEEFILKANKELRDRQLALTQERNQLEAAMYRAAAQEQGRALEDQVRQAKAAAEQQVMALQSQKDQELTLLDTSNRDQINKVVERSRIETTTAMQTRDVRMALIDAEIEGQRRLAAAYPAHAELQRAVETKVLELQNQRVQVENQTNSAILQSRRQLVTQLNDLAEREAGVGRAMLDQSLAQAEKLGRTTISLAAVQRDAAREAERAQRTIERFEAGQTVRIEDLRRAMAVTPIARQMQEMGAAGQQAPFLQAFVQQQAGAFGPTPQMRTPLTMGAADMFALAAQQVQVSDTSISRINESVGKAIDRIVPEVVEKTFDVFTDKLIRKLEFEAARA